MTRLTLKQEYRKAYKEMYQRLTQAIKSDKKHDEEMEASVKLRLPELKWLESQMWRLRRIFLDQTDVLDQGETAFVLTTIEVILEKVLLAFSEKYLSRENEDKLSFLTLSEPEITHE